MKIFLNKNTHVGTDEPADKTKTWLPQNLTEEANFLSNPATYGVLSGPRVKIAESLDAQNIDAYGEKLRAYEVEPSTLVIKEYKNGAWVNMDLNLDVPETKNQLAIQRYGTIYYWDVDNPSALWLSLNGKYDTTNSYYIHCPYASSIVEWYNDFGAQAYVTTGAEITQYGDYNYSISETYYATGDHAGGAN